VLVGAAMLTPEEETEKLKRELHECEMSFQTCRWGFTILYGEYIEMGHDLLDQQNAIEDLQTQATDLAHQLAFALQRIAKLENKKAGASPDHFREALVHLRSGPCTIARIAKVCGVSKSQGRNLTNRLRSEGLVKLEPDPKRRDGRITVFITTNGVDYVK
jgi:DNA-binding MarR family transcriptional regulator